MTIHSSGKDKSNVWLWIKMSTTNLLITGAIRTKPNIWLKAGGALHFWHRQMVALKTFGPSHEKFAFQWVREKALVERRTVTVQLIMIFKRLVKIFIRTPSKSKVILGSTMAHYHHCSLRMSTAELWPPLMIFGKTGWKRLASCTQRFAVVTRLSPSAVSSTCYIPATMTHSYKKQPYFTGLKHPKPMNALKSVP